MTDETKKEDDYLVNMWTAKLPDKRVVRLGKAKEVTADYMEGWHIEFENPTNEDAPTQRFRLSPEAMNALIRLWIHARTDEADVTLLQILAEAAASEREHGEDDTWQQVKETLNES